MPHRSRTRRYASTMTAYDAASPFASRSNEYASCMRNSRARHAPTRREPPGGFGERPATRASVSEDHVPPVGRPDPDHCRAAVALGVVAIAVTMLGGFVQGAWFRQDRGWQIAGDVWVPLRAAEAIANGRLTHLYASTPLFVAMPLLPILLVPVAEVGRVLHLTQSIPTEIP